MHLLLHAKRGTRDNQTVHAADTGLRLTCVFMVSLSASRADSVVRTRVNSASRTDCGWGSDGDIKSAALPLPPRPTDCDRAPGGACLLFRPRSSSVEGDENGDDVDFRTLLPELSPLMITVSSEEKPRGRDTTNRTFTTATCTMQPARHRLDASNSSGQ